eukprot:contig_21450_g5286
MQHGQVVVGRWMCDRDECGKSVEDDGARDALFNLRRRNRQRHWVIFTHALLDVLLSFIINARTTYTAATRHLSANVHCFSFRRQDVVKFGTAMLRVFIIPAETGRCPLCGPRPDFIVIDGQALGCTDPDGLHPTRDEEECPVLDIQGAKLCILENAGLRAAIVKVLRSATALTDAQETLLRNWNQRMMTQDRATVDVGAAYLFFKFFPIVDQLPMAGARSVSGNRPAPAPQPPGPAVADVEYQPSSCRKRTHGSTSRTLDDALRLDADGELNLGGKGLRATKPVETWRDRTGLCSPNIRDSPRDDDGAWLAVLQCFQAMLGETVSGMFHGHDESAIRLAAHTLRLKGAGAWREITAPLEGIGFVASFMGRFAFMIDADSRFRMALGQLLLEAVSVEKPIDDMFAKAASSPESQASGWVNAEYCRQWGGTPTPGDYQRWRVLRSSRNDEDIDDPLTSYEHFAGLPRVRPGIKDC